MQPSMPDGVIPVPVCIYYFSRFSMCIKTPDETRTHVQYETLKKKNYLLTETPSHRCATAALPTAPVNQCTNHFSSSTISIIASSSSGLLGKMFDLFSILHLTHRYLKPSNGCITDSQQTSNRHKSSSNSRYGSVYNQSLSSSSNLLND
jgi:hypothetical protein